MKLTSWYEIHKTNFKVGDTIWACNYRATLDKEGLRYIQTPIQGIFSFANSEKEHEKAIQQGKVGAGCIKYFIPLKKNGTEPAWSKAVSIEAREYATTEEECKELYNELIDDYISLYEREIEYLKKAKIK